MIAISKIADKLVGTSVSELVVIFHTHTHIYPHLVYFVLYVMARNDALASGHTVINVVI